MIPYIFFDGTCAEAIQFYSSVFGGEIAAMQRWSEMPPNPEYPIPDDQKNRVMHARLDAKGFSLMASDGRPGSEYKGGNISLSLNFDESGEGEKLFDALASEGAVETPLTAMFWGAKFGQVTDKFGVDWMFNITLAGAPSHN